MVDPAKKASDAAKKAAGKAVEKANEVTGKAGKTKRELDKMKQKVEVLSEAGKQLRELAIGFKNFDKQEKLRRIGGLVALVTLGMLFDKEDVERFKKGEDEIEEDETTEETAAAKERHDEDKKKAEEDAKKSPEEKPQEKEEFKPDEVIARKQCATNMYAIRYYNEDGTKHPKPNTLAKICIKEKAIPSKFILQRSGALFKEGVGTFDFFRKNVSDKLVQDGVKDKKERERQAAVILSCCAVGRFQIVPIFHFKRMGWPTKGEEGLRAMYEFIRSSDRQVALFKRILEKQWNNYQDVGLVAVAYYAGAGNAKAYKNNPNAKRFHDKQYGGHWSIDDYAKKARKNFARYKQEIPGLDDLTYVAMTIEANETGGGYILRKAKGEAEPKPKRRIYNPPPPKGTKAVKNSELTPEMQEAAKEALRETNGKPVGTEVEKVINGRTYVAQRQTHTNKVPEEEGGAPGIGLFLKEESKPEEKPEEKKA